MALRICLVTPFSWSLPHDVNEHVGGVAAALRRRGHTVTVVAPSSRAADLLEGRRALQRGAIGDVVAIGAALPTSLSERVALPMGVRANLATALSLGSFDVVHGFEPGVSSLSSAALLEAHSMTAATFFSTERIAVPPRKNKRAQLLARVDVLLGTSDEAITHASDRFPGDYERVSIGVDSASFSPSPKRKVIVVELAPGQSAIAKAMLRLLPTLPGWELVLARTAPLTRRPAIPAKLRDRARVRSLVKRGRSTVDPRGDGDLRPGSRWQRAARARSTVERLRNRGARGPCRATRARVGGRRATRRRRAVARRGSREGARAGDVGGFRRSSPSIWSPCTRRRPLVGARPLRARPSKATS